MSSRSLTRFAQGKLSTGKEWMCATVENGAVLEADGGHYVVWVVKGGDEGKVSQEAKGMRYQELTREERGELFSVACDCGEKAASQLGEKKEEKLSSMRSFACYVGTSSPSKQFEIHVQVLKPGKTLGLSPYHRSPVGKSNPRTI